MLRRLRVSRRGSGFVPQVRYGITWYNIDHTNVDFIYPSSVVPEECLLKTRFSAYRCLVKMRLELIRDKLEKALYD